MLWWTSLVRARNQVQCTTMQSRMLMLCANKSYNALCLFSWLTVFSVLIPNWREGHSSTGICLVISIGILQFSSNAGISSKKRNCYLRDGWWTQFKSRRKVLGELGPLPDFVTTILARIADQGLSSPPNHLLVNEYEPGQGIMPHTGMASLVSSYLTLILYTNLALKMLRVYLAPLLCRCHYFRLASWNLQTSKLATLSTFYYVRISHY